MSGTFDLKIGNQFVKDIPSNIDADTLEMLLEANLKDEGGFLVSPESEECTGYSWQVHWETRGGDMEPIGVDISNLDGDGVEYTVTTLLDGGTWIRPFGGEMLRLPMTEPQVSLSPHPLIVCVCMCVVQVTYICCNANSPAVCVRV